MSDQDSGTAQRRRFVQGLGRSVQLVAHATVVPLPKGDDQCRPPPPSTVARAANPAELLREAVEALAITPDVPAVWCLATYAALVERIGLEGAEARVVALREDADAIRVDRSARPHASDDVGHRMLHLASTAASLGFERLAREAQIFHADLQSHPTTCWRAYLDRALAVAIDAIDAHFALAAA